MSYYDSLLTAKYNTPTIVKSWKPQLSDFNWINTGFNDLNMNQHE